MDLRDAVWGGLIEGLKFLWKFTLANWWLVLIVLALVAFNLWAGRRRARIRSSKH